MNRPHDVLKPETWFMLPYIPASRRPTFESFKQQTRADGRLIANRRISDDPNDELGAMYFFDDVTVQCQVCGNPYHTQRAVVYVDENDRVSGYFAMCPACRCDEASRTRQSPLSREQIVSFLIEGATVPRHMLGKRFENFDSKCIKAGSEIVSHVKEFADIHADRLVAVMAGGTGTGKTHLSVSALYRYLFQDTHKSVSYVRASDMFQEIKDSIGQRKGFETIFKKYVVYDFLIIDEISKSLFSKFTAETFQNIVQARIEYGVKTVLAGNVGTEVLAELLGSAVTSRIKAVGTVLTFDGTDYRETHRVL